MKCIFKSFAIVLLATMLAACGDKEPEQRAAFMQFLQTRLIDKPGVRVPKLTDEEKKSLGGYAEHYAVITEFSSGMDTSIKPLGSLIQKARLRSLGDIIAHREDLEMVRTAANDIATVLNTQQSRADAARGQLRQPDDLKKVYDKAYDKTVTLPASTYREVLPQINATIDSSLKIIDYVNQHKAQIEISGSAVRVNDPAVQENLNALLQDLNTQARSTQQAQARVQAIMYGR
ncbi:DUF3053 domain-containing protein [Delftia sp. PS-11]|uniref:DUF3053 domain-containing protein n=1 Tax=Delftia sp. PS-11 TaxID=2767222 RepID=UPI002456FE2C|nr:DUF3053 domain-containing protein [Delftia sp. PS-11]KAJ8746213.1 DUF3053 domain-containing protein [Delftia sp. PS-11]